MTKLPTTPTHLSDTTIYIHTHTHIYIQKTFPIKMKEDVGMSKPKKHANKVS